MTSNPKFRPPVFSRDPSAKHQTHDSGWAASISAAIARGIPESWKRLSVIYRGTAPHIDPAAMTAPIEPRPSSEPVEPVDVPAVAPEQTRDLPPLHSALLRQMKR